MSNDPVAGPSVKGADNEVVGEAARDDAAGSQVKHSPLPVLVDPTFQRVFADHAVVMHLGRDTEIAFLAAGGEIQSVEGLFVDEQSVVKVNSRPQLNEVVRVRVSPMTAVTLAMEVFQRLTKVDLVNIDEVIASIEAMRGPAVDSEVQNDA